jgi:hypothetical protein
MISTRLFFDKSNVEANENAPGKKAAIPCAHHSTKQQPTLKLARERGFPRRFAKHARPATGFPISLPAGRQEIVLNFCSTFFSRKKWKVVFKTA